MAGTWNVTRRDFLRAVGIGGATVLATGGRLGAAGSEPPPPTEPESEQVGWRRPNGPTVEQLAADLEYDVERIFRFVSDEIRYDPYVGVLRGATGTLWSRAGNSADQAVLLAGMLNAALVETRFVTGALDDAGAARLTAAATIDEVTLREQLAPVFAVSREATAEELDAVSSADIAALPERSAALRAAARAQLADGVSTIGSSLAAAGIELPAAEFHLPDRELAEHVWVQYASGARWIDLDPSVPGGEPGAVLTDAASTLPTLPDELRHAVTVALTAEVIAGGAPAHQQLISYHAFTEQLVGLPISIGHAKPEALAAIGASITDALSGTVQYIPIIFLGDTAEGADSRVTFVTGEGALDVFGDTSTEGDTLAEWLELTLTSPDAAPRTVVREIFDRVGYAARQGGDIDLESVEPIELVDLDADTPREFLPLRAVWSLAVTGAGVPFDYFDQDPEIDDLFADLGLLSEGYSLIREGLNLDVGAASGYRYVTGAPNVTAFVAGPRAVTPSGPEIETRLDLFAHSAVAVPLAGAEPAEAHPGVVAGVLAHVAERVTRGGGESVSVGRVFEAAAGAGIAIRTFGPDDGDLPALAVSAEARLRIAAAVESGLIVVVPERAVALGDREVVGWWLVDPVTGATADEFEDGRGTSFTEYANNLRTSFRAWGGFRRLGGCVGKHAAIAAAALGVAGAYQGNPEAVGYVLGAAQTALEAAGDGLGAFGC